MTQTINLDTITSPDIKWAFSTRRVHRNDVRGIATDLQGMVFCEVFQIFDGQV